MLSDDDLKPHYGKVTWLFVTRNFKSDAKDREAMRTHDRFGITSWPHCVLFDPRDDRVLARLPRNLKGFVAGLDRHCKAVPAADAAARSAADKVEQALAKRENGDNRTALRLLTEVLALQDEAGIWLYARELQRDWEGDERQPITMLDDPDVRQRAIAVETIASLPLDQQKMWLTRMGQIGIDADEHLIVRLRALPFTHAKLMRDRAEALLSVASDPFRFQVLKVLAKEPTPELTPLFLRLFRDAGKSVPSSNPNVLRIHLARCLRVSGDQSAVPALAEVAKQANVRNGLTGVVIDALAAIASRGDSSLRRKVVQELCSSFPVALEDSAERLVERGEARLLYSSKRLVAALFLIATGLPRLPTSWSRRDREEFLAKLKSVRAR